MDTVGLDASVGLDEVGFDAVGDDFGSPVLNLGTTLMVLPANSGDDRISLSTSCDMVKRD